MNVKFNSRTGQLLCINLFINPRHTTNASFICICYTRTILQALLSAFVLESNWPICKVCHFHHLQFQKPIFFVSFTTNVIASIPFFDILWLKSQEATANWWILWRLIPSYSSLSQDFWVLISALGIIGATQN